jgi:hypothetical protein
LSWFENEFASLAFHTRGLRRTPAAFDRHRLGTKDDVADHVKFRGLHGLADRVAWIAPISPEDGVLGSDRAGFILRIGCDNRNLSARPAEIGRNGRQAE